MDLSKNDYNILIILNHYQCNSKLKSFTIERISKETNLSIPKIRNSVKMFLLLNYITEGSHDKSAKTYYINENGINELKSLI